MHLSFKWNRIIARWQIVNSKLCKKKKKKKTTDTNHDIAGAFDLIRREKKNNLKLLERLRVKPQVTNYYLIVFPHLMITFLEIIAQNKWAV